MYAYWDFKISIFFNQFDYKEKAWVQHDEKHPNNKRLSDSLFFLKYCLKLRDKQTIRQLNLINCQTITQHTCVDLVKIMVDFLFIYLISYMYFKTSVDLKT